MEIDAVKLKSAMMASCLSVVGLVRKSGVSQATISGLIHHGGRPNLATIGKVAKALDVPPDSLIKQD
jgi:transcriptional regulator with XRE-family HTH domain